MELWEIQSMLAAEGVDSELEKVSPENPLANLTVRLDREHEVQLLYLEGMEESAPGLRLLQIYIALPCELETSAVAEVHRALPVVNRYLPLMAFGLYEDQLLYFRHVLLLPAERSPSDGELIFSAIRLGHRIVDHYGPRLEKVARGEATASALAQG